MSVLQLVIPPRRRTSTEASRVALFREAAAVAESDLAQTLTLDEVAERVNASSRQLRRAFAEVGGTTFSAYLREARMARAAQLLARSDDPIREIAAEVGYTEPSQFTKAFRRSYGTTPTAYRLRGSQ